MTNTGGVHSAGGGGIRAADSDPIILGNVIMNNKGHYGAGIALYYSSGIVSNNLIYNNSGGSYYNGGGIWALGSLSDSVEIINNTVTDNYSFLRGGGVYLGSCTAIVKNNIIWGNYGLNGGHQIYQTGAAVEVSYSDIQDGYSGTGNIDSDPLFSDLNFHLSINSLCIDSGDPSSGSDPEDSLNPGFALFSSMGNLRLDIGCYGGMDRIEFPDITSYVGIDEGKTKIIDQDQILDIRYGGSGCIEIRLNLPRAGKVTLKIYDLKGSLINTLYNRIYLEKRVIIYWDKTDSDNIEVSSGIYLLEIQVDDFTFSDKLLVLK